jgi:hypothetical protein
MVFFMFKSIFPSRNLNPISQSELKKFGKRVPQNTQNRILCIEIENTLIRTLDYQPNTNNFFKISYANLDEEKQVKFCMYRKHSRQFITNMSKLFQIVLFTNHTREFVDQFLNKFDP